MRSSKGAKRSKLEELKGKVVSFGAIEQGTACDARRCGAEQSFRAEKG